MINRNALFVQVPAGCMACQVASHKNMCHIHAPLRCSYPHSYVDQALVSLATGSSDVEFSLPAFWSFDKP